MHLSPVMRNLAAVPSMKVIEFICRHFDSFAASYCEMRKCCKYDVTFLSLRTNSRKRYRVYARKYVCYYLYNYCGWTMEQIGLFLGNRDHTTVVHALKDIEDNLLATWHNEDKDHFQIIGPELKRPSFPNYNLLPFYAKHGIKITKKEDKRRRKPAVSGKPLHQPAIPQCAVYQ